MTGPLLRKYETSVRTSQRTHTVHLPYQTRQSMYILRNNEQRSCNHFCSGKAISITYSQCLSVSLVTQHAMRMRHFILSSWPVRLYGVSRHSHKRHDLRGEKKLVKVKCVLNFCTQNTCFPATSVWNISHSKEK